jgi:hypothetical protein
MTRTTDEESDPKQINRAVNLEEDMLPDKEIINQDPDSKEEEAQAA